MAGPTKVHEVFLPAPLLSWRPPSSRCEPALPLPPRATPGTPGRPSPSLAVALLCSLRGGGTLPTLHAPPTSFQTHIKPLIQSSHHLGPPRGEITFCGIHSGQILRARPGRPRGGVGWGAEPPGTAAAPFSWQTRVELTRQKAGWEVPVRPLARGGRRVHAGPSLAAWLGRTF